MIIMSQHQPIPTGDPSGQSTSHRVLEGRYDGEKYHHHHHLHHPDHHDHHHGGHVIFIIIPDVVLNLILTFPTIMHILIFSPMIFTLIFIILSITTIINNIKAILFMIK